MTLVFLVAVILVIAVIIAVAAGRFAGGMVPAISTVPPVRLPAAAQPLHPADLDDLRFQTVLRGYRMEQVDAALDRLREELVRQSEVCAHLQAQLDATALELALVREQRQAPGSEA